MFKQTSLFKIPIPFLGTFEEINLRFYVKRIEGDIIKRGVVFINETVPFTMVAWLANKLYKEHYIAIPTKNQIINHTTKKNIRYDWKINKNWNHLAVNTTKEQEEMLPDSIEEFIFEHYYGYTKINTQRSQEYKVNHPRWQVNKIIDAENIIGAKLFYISTSPYDKELLFENRLSYEEVLAGKRRTYFSFKNFFDIFKMFLGIIHALYKIFSIFPENAFEMVKTRLFIWEGVHHLN